MDGGKAALKKTQLKPPVSGSLDTPKAAVVQRPPFLDKGVPTCKLNVEDKVAAESRVLDCSCEYVNTCSVRDNGIYFLRVQTCVLCLCSLKRTGEMRASAGILDSFKPFLEAILGVPSTKTDMDILVQGQQRATEVTEGLESQVCEKRLRDVGYSARRRLRVILRMCINT